jgi:hypothetical protein
MFSRACVVTFLLCAGAGFESPALADSSSASYRLKAVTLDAAGAASASPSRVANGSLGQELVVGVSAAPHFILQSGFWSYLGSTVVPVVLAVNRDPGDAAAIDLTWTGNNALYDVYSSSNGRCASLFGAVPAGTTANAYVDSTVPEEPLVCYSVLAVAPGPLAPPPGASLKPSEPMP